MELISKIIYMMQENHMLFTRGWNSSAPEQLSGASWRGNQRYFEYQFFIPPMVFKCFYRLHNQWNYNIYTDHDSNMVSSKVYSMKCYKTSDFGLVARMCNFSCYVWMESWVPMLPRPFIFILNTLIWVWTLWHIIMDQNHWNIS